MDSTGVEIEGKNGFGKSFGGCFWWCRWEREFIRWEREYIAAGVGSSGAEDERTDCDGGSAGSERYRVSLHI